MPKYIVIFTFCLAAIAGSGLAQTPTAQDCLGAIPICQSTISIPNPYPYSGNGNYSSEILSLAACYTTEANGVWFTFTVQTSGLLRFSLTPNNTNNDYDWILYNMTNGSCATLSTSSASSLMVSSNNWGVFGNNGPTGISTPNGGTGNCNGPGNTNGPKWNADLSVTAGNTYVLYVSNWSNSTYGFSLDFSASTAVLFDDVPPAMDNIVSSIECAAFDSLVIEFTENIVCDSTETGDFTLIGPGGTHTITSVSSAACSVGADYDDTYTIHFSPPVSQIGDYVLAITPGAGFVEDLCGNKDTLDTIGFYYSGSVSVSLSGTHPLCHDYCTGTIEAETSGGAAPFEFDWNNGLPSDSTQTNVCAGTYIVTVTDDLECEALDTIVITEPTALSLGISNVVNVSCPGTSNCDGGAQVNVTGATPPYAFTWTSGETTPVASTLCAGENWVVVTDTFECIDSISVDILVPDTIVTTAFGDTQICITNAASIIASSTGGTPPFTYVWTEGALNGPVVSVNTGTQVYPHVDTYYYVTSTDSRGCPGDTSEVLIKVRPPLGVELPRKDTICPYDEITLLAEGQGGDSIYSYVWSSGGFGPTLTVGPDVSQWFTVTVTDLCGTPAFWDSVFVQVGGYSEISADIRVEDDSLCPGESIYLIASGRGGFKGPDEYRFQWNFTSDTNRVQFVTPLKTKKYTVTITDLCLSPEGADTTTVYVGETEFPKVTISPAEACANSDVGITIESLLPGYDYDWLMGDGEQYNNVQDTTFIHNYHQAGCYDLELNMTSDFGCYGELYFPCAVRILQQPVANFDQQPEYPTNLEPILMFRNTSKFAEENTWYIDGLVRENTEVFSHEFRPSHYPYKVSLVVISSDGCLDTLTKELNYMEETVLYFPSSFTPNGDGVNDVFLIQGEAIDLAGFDLVIYDRWGTQVFRSVNPDHGWNGTYLGGEKVPMGAYPFTLRYRDRGGEPKVIHSEVIVSKTGERTGLR